MVAVVVFTDEGDAYCMSHSPSDAADIIHGFRDKLKIRYIKADRQHAFLAKAEAIMRGDSDGANTGNKGTSR